MGTGVSVAGSRLMSTRPQAVRTWLAEHGEVVGGPVGIRRVGIGQSNITSIVTDRDGREWVLREPPPGTKQGNAVIESIIRYVG